MPDRSIIEKLRFQEKYCERMIDNIDSHDSILRIEMTISASMNILTSTLDTLHINNISISDYLER